MITNNSPTRRGRLSALLGVLVLALAGCGRTAVQPAPASAEERNERAVARAFEAWRSGTGGPVSLLAPDVTWTVAVSTVVPSRYESRRQFLDSVATPLNKRFTKPLVPTVLGLYADGDTVVVLFDAEGTARDGKPYRNTYTWYLKFRGEQVVEVVAMFDPRPFDDLWSRIQP